jgi:hypothetical protein
MPECHGTVHTPEWRYSVATGASPWESFVGSRKQTVPTGLRPWLNSVAAPRLDLRYSAIPAFFSHPLARGATINRRYGFPRMPSAALKPIRTGLVIDRPLRPLGVPIGIVVTCPNWSSK